MRAVRLAKIAMVASLALFALAVGYDNIVDNGPNYAFVQHVLSMDTTDPAGALRSRAINSPVLWRMAYGGIIGGELLTGLMFAAGAVALARQIRASPQSFAQAKQLTLAGAGIAFLLWFTGFMVVGGEWFASWQSKDWNGQTAAFRFYMSVLAVTIFVGQNEPD